MNFALLLALALWDGTEAAAPAPAPAQAGEPTIMIVEFPRGVPMIGFPRRCPGSTEEVPPEDEVCLAEMYQGWALVVRHLSGPRVARRSFVRLTAHARGWRPGTRMLVVTRPFEDRGTRGNFAFWWDLPEEHGDYCRAVDDLARDVDGPLKRVFSTGYRIRFHPYGYAERTDFRCIRGQAMVIRDL